MKAFGGIAAMAENLKSFWVASTLKLAVKIGSLAFILTNTINMVDGKELDKGNFATGTLHRSVAVVKQSIFSQSQPAFFIAHIQSRSAAGFAVIQKTDIHLRMPVEVVLVERKRFSAFNALLINAFVKSFNEGVRRPSLVCFRVIRASVVGFVRAISINANAEIAIVTKDAISAREIVSTKKLAESVRNTVDFTIFSPTAFDVIERQELKDALAATSTSRNLQPAVVPQDLKANLASPLATPWIDFLQATLAASRAQPELELIALPKMPLVERFHDLAAWTPLFSRPFARRPAFRAPNDSPFKQSRTRRDAESSALAFAIPKSPFAIGTDIAFGGEFSKRLLC